MPPLLAIKGCQDHWTRFKAQWETWLEKSIADVRFFDGPMLGVPDDYEHLPQKTQAICAWAAKHGYFHAFLADTDTYISLPRLLGSDYKNHDYIGYRLEGKDYASGGAGYWLSQKAMEAVARGDAAGFKFEDEMVGTLVKQAGIELHHDPRYALYQDVLPGNDIISRHLSSRGPFEIGFMYAAHRRAHP